MALDNTFAYLHLLFIITMASLIVSELALYQPRMPADSFRRLGIIDLLYLFAAIGVVATGLSRAIWFAKGWDYYHANWIFWTKMAVSTAVGLLSLPPTLHFLREYKAQGATEWITVEPDEYRLVRRFILAEAIGVVLLPLLAILMARGYGYS